MNDWDFLVGTWHVANRWRTDFLDESSPWEEFPAVSQATRHFDGAASVDEITFPTKGFAGITAQAAHWEQAFSTDGGQTWLTNWHMDLTRRA